MNCLSTAHPAWLSTTTMSTYRLRHAMPDLQRSFSTLLYGHARSLAIEIWWLSSCGAIVDRSSTANRGEDLGRPLSRDLCQWYRRVGEVGA
jgi:hypothetical protein